MVVSVTLLVESKFVAIFALKIYVYQYILNKLCVFQFSTTVSKFILLNRL
jgi:hypothetical protein